MSMEPIVQIIFALLPSYPLPTICFRSVTSNNIPFLYLKKKIVPLIFIFFFLLCTSIFPSFPQFGRGIGVISSFCPKQKHALCSQTSVIPFFLLILPAPCLLLQNQFFISGLQEDGIIQNRVMEALYRRILLAHKQQKCFRAIIVIPLLPGFQV